MIGLTSFIKSVKQDLLDAECAPGDTPLLYLDDVQLEVSFQAEVNAEGKIKLLVVDSKANVTAATTHKVSIKLKPLTESQKDLLDNVYNAPSNKIKYEPPVFMKDKITDLVATNLSSGTVFAREPKANDLPAFLKMEGIAAKGDLTALNKVEVHMSKTGKKLGIKGIQNTMSTPKGYGTKGR
jgi:hypothetical protein